MTDRQRRVPARAALITGAANGIGREMARLLATNGWRLALVDVDEAALTALVDELAMPGVEIRPTVVDVADAAAVRRVVEETVDEFGAVDLCAPIAGVFVPGSWEELSLDALELSLAVNFVHVVACTTAVLELARQHRFPCRFVFAGSDAAERRPRRLGAYATAKQALAGFARSLRRELDGDPDFTVTLGVIHPTRTRFGRHSRTVLRHHGIDDPPNSELGSLDATLAAHGRAATSAAADLLEATMRGRPVVRVGSWRQRVRHGLFVAARAGQARLHQ